MKPTTSLAGASLLAANASLIGAGVGSGSTIDALFLNNEMRKESTIGIIDSLAVNYEGLNVSMGLKNDGDCCSVTVE